MLVGTADPERLAEGAATLPDFAAGPVRLEGVETLQVLYEIERAGADGLLPPGLHPTVPPLVNWWVQRVAESPWGGFSMALCRIECRSGLRPRGFLRAGVIDNSTAGAALAAGWGYALAPGQIDLDHGYDRTRGRVLIDGEDVLDLALEDPEPLAPGDVFYAASMHLAHTPRGVRLVQVDPDFEPERVERGRPRLRSFAAGAWRSECARPAHPVSAVFSVGTVTLPALRFVCRPDAVAFVGTERLDA